MKNFILKFRNLYEILYDATVGFIVDDAFTHSAAVSYFVLLSIIPVIVLTVSILSYFLGSTETAYNWILQQITYFSPDIAMRYDISVKVLTEEIINIRGTALGLGIISLLWIGMNTVCSLENSLNVVMKITVARNFFQRRLISLILILLLFITLYGTTIVSAIITTTFHKQNILLNFLDIDVSLLWSWGTKFSSIIVYFLAFYLIYRVLPRIKMPEIALLMSSFWASIVWSIAKSLFSWFVINISQYSKIYGSMAALFIFVIWLYFSVVIMIYFGEMVYAIKQRIRPSIS